MGVGVNVNQSVFSVIKVRQGVAIHISRPHKIRHYFTEEFWNGQGWYTKLEEDVRKDIWQSFTWHPHYDCSYSTPIV